MTTAIVGYTGFVGSNLCLSHDFDAKYNSRNIQSAYGTAPELLVYCGVPAEMFLANNFPEKDIAIIKGAIENIRLIEPRKVVLISTISVYGDAVGVNENTVIDDSKTTHYGRHRHMLEQWVQENCPDHCIVRLPALYGHGLKKNFIYDVIHVIPSLLNEKKMVELSDSSTLIATSYTLQDNGFYRLNVSHEDSEALEKLKAEFMRLGFTALTFTDSRSRYQFFNLNGLWHLIQTALNADLKMLNVATPPVSASEVYEYIYGEKFVNELNRLPFNYDFRSEYAPMFGGEDGYLISKEEELSDIKKFVQSQTSQHSCH